MENNNNLNCRNIYRLKFEKTGAMKFIGHLDLLKLFQRAVKRSGLPVAYSQGFNPHQIMSFALPLSVGIESIGEIVEIEFAKDIVPNETMEKLNDVMPCGIEVAYIRKLENGEKNAASLVSAAKYGLIFPETFTSRILKDAANEILAETQIMVLKAGKKGEKQVDIRPLIYDLANSDEERAINATLAAGSANNLKAERLAEIFCKKCEFTYNSGCVKITRKVLFGGECGGWFEL